MEEANNVCTILLQIPPLQCIQSIVSNTTAAGQVSPQEGAQVLDVVSALWRVIPLEHPFTASSGGDADVRDCYLAALLSLTSDVMDQLDTKLLLQVLEADTIFLLFVHE